MIKLVFILLFFFSFATLSYSSPNRLALCAPYKNQVQSILSQYDLSPDFYYLMVAESTCRNSISNQGARGFWQLMPHIQRYYGCADYSDYVCQTHAASKYLVHLSEMFNNDFRMVIMAYNQGGHNLKKDGPTKSAMNLYRYVVSLIKEDKNDWSCFKTF